MSCKLPTLSQVRKSNKFFGNKGLSLPSLAADSYRSLYSFAVCTPSSEFRLVHGKISSLNILEFPKESNPKALKYVHLVHEDETKFLLKPQYKEQYENMKNLPIDSALRVHYSKLDAKETSQKMEKMAVCVKPFHLNYNRALWVSF